MAERSSDYHLAQKDETVNQQKNMSGASNVEGIKFAAADGKDTLYKFRPYGSTDMRSRVREIILDHRVYFSRRSQLNDPFDVAPAFVLDMTGGELETRKRLMAEAKEGFQRQGFSTPNANALLAALAVRPLEVFESDARERVLARLEETYWIFSLAGNRTHPMMWAHYADGHKGLCIHFSAREPSIFSVAMKIHYEAARPIVRIPLPVEKELMHKIILTKGNFWEYEDEYRLARFPEQDRVYEGLGLQFDDQKATYKDTWLSGITVGYRMPAANVEEVLKLAKDHSRGLPVWRARPTLTYELEFEQIG